MALLTIGDQFPAYRLTALIAGDLSGLDAQRPQDYFSTVGSDDHPGRWRVIFFWPTDFTLICPAELAAFGDLEHRFADRGAQLLGASTDTGFAHFRWRTRHRRLKTLPFPMLSDPRRELAAAAGVLNAAGAADRATFIVDPGNAIRYVSVTGEVLHALVALQSTAAPVCGLPPLRASA